MWNFQDFPEEKFFILHKHHVCMAFKLCWERPAVSLCWDASYGLLKVTQYNIIVFTKSHSDIFRIYNAFIKTEISLLPLFFGLLFFVFKKKKKILVRWFFTHEGDVIVLGFFFIPSIKIAEIIVFNYWYIADYSIEFMRYHYGTSMCMKISIPYNMTRNVLT